MTRDNRRNYYRLLQVQPDASVEVIKASHRALMRTLKYHPDLGGDHRDAALINAAYAALSNAQTRKRYDREQRELKRHVGSTARASSGRPNATHSPPTPPHSNGRPSPSRPGPAESVHRADRPSTNLQTCEFCKTENSGSAQRASEVCSGCGGPRWRIDANGADVTQHTRQRIAHQTDIQYRVDTRKLDSIRGRVVDLSPTGLRFVSGRRLTPGCVIKIDSPTLSTIARVIRSSADATTESFSTGVRFLTLKLEPRGMFVSENA